MRQSQPSRSCRRGAPRGSRSQRPVPLPAAAAGGALGDFDAEGVVAEEDVADAGDEHAEVSSGHARCRRRLDLVRVEEQVAALPGELVRRRVVVDGHGHVLAPSTSLKTPATVARGRRGTGPGHRRGATAAAGPGCPSRPLRRPPSPSRSTGRQRRRRPGPTRDSTGSIGVRQAPRRQDGNVDLQNGHCRRSAGRRERTAPWSRSHISGGMSSHRSIMARRAGRCPRASDFSSSVSVSTRNARISSISSGVVEVSGALRGHLRLVVKDDRRRQHDVVPADQHRERPLAVTAGDRLPRFVGRVEQRDEGAVVDGEHRVDGDEGIADHVVARRLSPSTPWCSPP